MTGIAYRPATLDEATANLAVLSEIAPEIPRLPKPQQGKFRRVIGKIFHPLKASGSGATEKLDSEKLRNP